MSKTRTPLNSTVRVPAKTEAAKESRMSSAKSLRSYSLLDDCEKEKQIHLLKQLQDEIQDLKYENHELKFLLYVALKHEDCEEPAKKNAFQGEMESLARDYFEESHNAKNVQLELEAATNMLEESKWVQSHYEQRVREQELKIEELQKQLMDMKAKEFALLQLQLPTTDFRTSRTFHRNGNASPARQIKQSGRQRSLSTTGQHNVPKFSTYLPDNYKETVATLPPILDGRTHKSQPKFWPQMKNVT